MSELDAITGTPSPVTKQIIISDLKKLGLQEGMIVLVHSALSRLGWVCGGAVAVIEALMEVLGDRGTLMMPSHSGDLSDPAPWQNPAVPFEWHQIIRDNMPSFRKDLTPTRGMGVIAETFRKMDGVLRSDHPQVSFCAIGPQAEFLIGGHSLEMGLGEKSPLARLYDLDGSILLLGVGHENNTSMHLAEHRADFQGKLYFPHAAPVLENGKREWKIFDDLLINGDDFGKIGEAFDKTESSVPGDIGCAQGRLMKSRALVDFTVEHLPKIRGKA